MSPIFTAKKIKRILSKTRDSIRSLQPTDERYRVMEEETICDISKKHDVTPAQVMLRWHMQSDVIAIPKTVTPSRMTENLAVFDFELSVEEMDTIAGLDRNERNNQVPSEMNVR